MNTFDTALAYLRRDFLINFDMIDTIKRGAAKIVFASDDCVMTKDKDSEIIMLQTENLLLAERLLSDLPCTVTHIVAHNAALSELVAKLLHYNVSVPCHQAVYQKPPLTFTMQREFAIRPLREAEAGAASAMYGFSEDDALKHIRLGLMYGGFENGEIAAMIGQHREGSMGLLVVKEEFRRKGYGEIMEKFLINRLLEQGRTPYCQIVEGNTASLSLQRKLGLDVSSNMLYWMRRKPDSTLAPICSIE